MHPNACKAKDTPWAAHHIGGRLAGALGVGHTACGRPEGGSAVFRALEECHATSTECLGACCTPSPMRRRACQGHAESWRSSCHASSTHRWSQGRRAGCRWCARLASHAQWPAPAELSAEGGSHLEHTAFRKTGGEVPWCIVRHATQSQHPCIVPHHAGVWVALLRQEDRHLGTQFEEQSLS